MTLLVAFAIIGIAFFQVKHSQANNHMAQTNQPMMNTTQKTMMTNNENTENLQKIVLGAGCFWGVEKRYDALPGVVEATSGYAGGSVTPTYEEITKRKHRNNPENHAEVVQVTFDPSQITITQLLKLYFETHDPTQLNQQGNDIGTQYRSVIFTTHPAQARVAEQLKAQYQQKLSQAGFGSIHTQILPLSQFYAAEDYHQDYLKKNPQGYCPDHSTGVKFATTTAAPPDNTALKTGKHILVIDADYDCPYCKKFKQDVSEKYQGDIPMSFRLATQLQGLQITSPTWATPSVLFLENGKEVAGFQGYMTPKEFYQALGAFKLGNSEAYAVAFQKGTDNRFCRQYEKFKNTPDGYFIDSLSGAKLFDTKDRFNSGTGWLSFTKAMAGAVIEKPDNSHGMKRTEILSASSGMHLGHVFDDGPNGMPRYCINATVLEFLPKQKP